MMPQRVQEVQELLAGLCQQAEAQAPTEPLLLQALISVIDFLPRDIQPNIEHLVNLTRLRRGSYGTYVTINPDQLDHEHVLSLHEEEAGALLALERVRQYDIPARIARLNLAASPLPRAHALSQLQEQHSFAVLIPETVNRKAILAQLYPQLRDRTSLGAQLAAYDQRSRA
jgi:hypothetical protein